MIIDLLKFIVFVIVGLYIPGYLFFQGLKIKDFWVNFFFSITLGIVLVTIIGLIQRLINFDYIFPIYLIVTLGIFTLNKYYKDLNFQINLKNSWPIILVILAGIIFQNNLTFRSGITGASGINYWGPLGHDGIWHQSLVANLIQNTWPTNPGLSGSSLTNYHYYYDLFVAETSLGAKISVNALIYQLYPFLFSLLIGLGTITLVGKFTQSKLAEFLSLFFVYFGSSFGWVVSAIKGESWGGESTFWMNQPVSTNINPPFAISLILLIAGSIFVFEYLETKKKEWIIPIILISGLITEFKVYAGVLFLTTLALITLKRLVVNKDKSLLIVSIPSAIIAGLIFLPNNIGSAGLLIVKPFWLVNTMVSFGDRLGWEKLSSAISSYYSGNNYLKYVLAELLALTIFIIGNIGTRILWLVTLGEKKLFIKENIDKYLMIFLVTIISFVIPLIFIQKGNNWNIVQFSYYGLYLLGVLSGLGLASIKAKLNTLLYIVLVGLILLITPISSFFTFVSGFKGPVTTISSAELSVLQILNRLPSGVVLTYPYDEHLREKVTIRPLPLFAYETTNYVGAFSGKNVFVEDYMQQEILGNNIAGRLDLMSKYFKDLMSDKEADNFLKENNIRYVYVPQAIRPLMNIKVKGKIIYENNVAVLYEVYYE